MNPQPPRCETIGTTIELEGLLTEDQRRVSVADHQSFRESLAAPAPADPIDDMVAESNRGESP